jgi:hypothetical protein
MVEALTAHATKEALPASIFLWAHVLCVAPYAPARSSNILSVVVQIGSDEWSITVTEDGPKW